MLYAALVNYSGLKYERTIGVKVTRATFALLADEARRSGISVSDVVRKALAKAGPYQKAFPTTASIGPEPPGEDIPEKPGFCGPENG